MAVTDSTTPKSAEPIDAVAERLNDPAIAASLVTLLDNAELLSTLVLGLSGFMERGDMIMDAVAEGVNDIKAASGGSRSFPAVSELGALAGQLGTATPVIGQLLDSKMASPEMIALLSDLSEAATEGAERARTNDTSVGGIRDTYRALKDPDVQRGLGLFIEIARSLGRRMD